MMEISDSCCVVSTQHRKRPVGVGFPPSESVISHNLVQVTYQ